MNRRPGRVYDGVGMTVARSGCLTRTTGGTSIAEPVWRNMMRAFTTRPEIRGTFGVVATTHWIASAVGMSVLEKGGNAFDAAVAVGFTLQVVEPHLNGPLGEAPILVWNQKTRRAEMICGQGVAPAA